MSSKLIVIVNEELLLFSHYTVTTAFEDTAWRPQGVRVVRVCPNHISYRFGHFGPTETHHFVIVSGKGETFFGTGSGKLHADRTYLKLAPCFRHTHRRFDILHKWCQEWPIIMMSGITLTLIGLVGRCVPVPIYYFGLAKISIR